MNPKPYSLLLSLFICLQLAAQPTITGFLPSSGPAGTTVIISGTNFSAVPANNVVYFGAAKATVSAASANSLTVSVPDGSTYQPITVRVNNLVGYSNRPFITTYDIEGFTIPGTFTQQFDVTVGNKPQAVAISDLDADGVPDVVAARAFGADKLVTLRNTSAGGLLSFSPGSLVTVSASNAVGVEAADLTGDGKPELLSPLVNSNFFYIWLNTSTPGTISFGNQSIVSTAFGQNAIAVQDLDADGKPDVVTANTTSIAVLRNTSNGGSLSLGTYVDYSTGTLVTKVAIANIDDDGKPDIVILMKNLNQVGIYKNTSTPGNISFAARVDVPVPFDPLALAVGDLDGDGKPDLAITSNSFPINSVAIFRNTTTTGNISFATRISYDAGTSPVAIAINDLNGDAMPDLAISHSTMDSVSVLLNASTPGNISFQPKTDLYIAGGPVHLAIGDMDANGKPDIVTANINGNTVGVLRNLANAPVINSFTPALTGPGATVTISGLNLSGATSLSFGGVPASSFTVLNATTIQAVVANGASGAVSVTTPFGTNGLQGFTFTNELTVSSVTPLSAPVGTQVTINGANFSSNVFGNTVYFGDVKATVVSATNTSITVTVPASASYKPLSVTTGGFTRYAKQFTVTFPGASFNLLPHHFQLQSDVATGAHAFKLASGDLDGDGKADLVVTNSGVNTFSILKNTGTPGAITFAPKVDIATMSDPRGILIQDLDSDGMLDVALVNYGSNTISVYRNVSTIGNISFAARIDIVTGNGPQSVSAGDIDGDGKPDLVTANNSGGTVSVFQNAGSPGNISFNAQPVITVGNAPYTVSLSDYSDDGKPELAVTYDSQSLAVFLNISSVGSLSFAAAKTYSIPGGPSTIANLDVNQNDWMDIVLANAAAMSMTVLHNTSAINNFNFVSSSNLPAGGSLGIVAADLDGNSFPDVALPDRSQNRIIVYKNAYTGVLPFPFRSSQFAGGNDPVDAVATDLDGDGKPEIAVANYNGGSVTIFRNAIGEPNLVASGTNPVTGTVINTLRIDSSVQTHNGRPYVQRHYDINPQNNPSTSTATVTLFYLQEEFNNFNAHPLHGLSLPANPTDDAGKANLRIYQYHGFSATGEPGTYPGPGVVIDPDDDKIVWNSSARVWEVTFDVNGFSGFFAGSTGSSILPVNLVSFTAVRQGSAALLQWSTTREVMTDHFELQRSTDGRNFTTISNITAAGNSGNIRTYTYKDQPGGASLYYYRIRIVDRDGNFVYSNIIRLHSAVEDAVISIYPNPASTFIVINHPTSTRPAQLRLIDMAGRVVATSKTLINSSQSVIDVQHLQAGSYEVVWQDGKRTTTGKIVIR
ncbi:MAG: FG-GAP-like repeat-containing protein [Chitinophagaceae bacterium]